jgi:hypothetical protein
LNGVSRPVSLQAGAAYEALDKGAIKGRAVVQMF